MTTNQEVDAFLAHHGVIGMKWGHHKAHVDAKEYVRAKLAYGQGAGNRRKLIKARVEARKKADPEYAREFDAHVEKFSAREGNAARAKAAHNVKASGRATYKTARGVHRSLTGGFGSVTLASAAIAGAIVIGHKTGTDKLLLEKAGQLLRQGGSSTATRAWLRSQGVQL